MKKILPFLALPLLVVPFLVYAQVSAPGFTIFTVLGTVSDILKVVIPIIVTLVVIYFFYGVIKFVTAKSDEDRTEGRKQLITGIIALFIILSIWGIIAILQRTFLGGTGTVQTCPYPDVCNPACPNYAPGLCF